MSGAVFSVLFLAGCGDGYEMQPYSGTPYGDRTAGRGVEYVRASMMPQKGPATDKAAMPESKPVIEPPKAEAPAPALTPMPEGGKAEELDESMLKDGAEIFNGKMRK